MADMEFGKITITKKDRLGGIKHEHRRRIKEVRREKYTEGDEPATNLNFLYDLGALGKRRKVERKRVGSQIYSHCKWFSKYGLEIPGGSEDTLRSKLFS